MDKHQFSARRRIWGGTMRGLMLLCAAVTCALAVFLIVYVLVKGVPNLSWQLLSTKPSYLDGSIGILPDIITTVCTVLTTLLVVLPLGVCAAVYLWGDRIFEKCGIGRDEGGDGGKTLEIRGKRRLSARDGGANYQQS